MQVIYMKRDCGFKQEKEEYLRIFYMILDEMVRGMTQAELTDSISHNFIVQMIPHHRAAIEMSKNILQYTNDEQLREIADNIITEQTKSIEDMRRIECDCSALTNSSRDVCCYQMKMNQIMRNMFSLMRSAPAGKRVDCDFMWEMIPHHRGAVEMSTNALGFCICPELEPVLFAIISSQKKGIMQMQELLKKMGCCI